MFTSKVKKWNLLSLTSWKSFHLSYLSMSKISRSWLIASASARGRVMSSWIPWNGDWKLPMIKTPGRSSIARIPRLVGKSRFREKNTHMFFFREITCVFLLYLPLVAYWEMNIESLDVQNLATCLQETSYHPPRRRCGQASWFDTSTRGSGSSGKSKLVRAWDLTVDHGHWQWPR